MPSQTRPVKPRGRRQGTGGIDPGEIGASLGEPCAATDSMVFSQTDRACPKKMPGPDAADGTEMEPHRHRPNRPGDSGTAASRIGSWPPSGCPVTARGAGVTRRTRRLAHCEFAGSASGAQRFSAAHTSPNSSPTTDSGAPQPKAVLPSVGAGGRHGRNRHGIVAMVDDPGSIVSENLL